MLRSLRMEFKNEYVCDICPKKYHLKWNLLRHMKCHNANKYECDQCPKVFLRQDNLKRHSFVHRNPESQLKTCDISFYLCPHCGQKFTKEVYAENHIEHCNKCDPIQCDLCNIFFPNLKTFSRHQCNNDMTNQCNWCQKTFKTKQTSNQHKKSHFDWSQSECTIVHSLWL